MKHTTFSLATLGVASLLVFSNCKKEGPGGVYEEPVRAPYEVSYEQPDRINEIVNDLAREDYSFSFDKPIPEAGITQTAYGADSYLAFADPQDLICPEPIRFRQKKMPIWKIPTFIQPTCPDMIIDIARLSKLQDLIIQADPAQFEGLKQVELISGGGLLATEKFNQQFTSLKLDKIDQLTSDLNPQSYLLFNAPGDFSGGFTRNAYGYADLNEIVLRPYRKNLKDILKPKLKGCFDPIVLSTIRERLAKMDPAAFRGLTVTPLAENKSIAVLSYQY